MSDAIHKHMLLKRSGWCLAVVVLLLQVGVMLKPLLPENYQIAPVCLSLTHNLLSHHHHVHTHPTYHDLVKHLMHDDHHDHHDHNAQNHQCQYCTVYGDIVLPFKFGVDEIVDKIQVRLSFYQDAFRHVYFSLQKLYLLPQGRAPPLTF